MNRFVSLICCQIILTANSAVSLLIYCLLAIRFLVFCRHGRVRKRITFVFRSSEVRHLLLDLNTSGGTYQLGMSPRFLKENCCCSGLPSFNKQPYFARLVLLCSFPACWRQANITAIPKGPPSSPANRTIFLTSLLSKVFERQVSVCFQPPSLFIRTVWVELCRTAIKAKSSA